MRTVESNAICSVNTAEFIKHLVQIGQISSNIRRGPGHGILRVFFVATGGVSATFQVLGPKFKVHIKTKLAHMSTGHKTGRLHPEGSPDPTVRLLFDHLVINKNVKKKKLPTYNSTCVQEDYTSQPITKSHFALRIYWECTNPYSWSINLDCAPLGTLY